MASTLTFSPNSFFQTSTCGYQTLASGNIYRGIKALNLAIVTYQGLHCILQKALGLSGLRVLPRNKVSSVGLCWF